MQEGGNPASDHQSKPGWYFSHNFALWDLHQNNQADIFYHNYIPWDSCPLQSQCCKLWASDRSKYRHSISPNTSYSMSVSFCHDTISSKSWKSPVFAFWTLADEPEAVVCYRWVGNLQDLPYHDWVGLKSASNCNSLVPSLCILSWPAAPCNGFQWCQRHDHRCRCRTSRSSRGVETMQKPWFQEGWTFRQGFDWENEIVIIDVTTTNQK